MPGHILDPFSVTENDSAILQALDILLGCFDRHEILLALNEPKKNVRSSACSVILETPLFSLWLQVIPPINDF
jgi:hypothetical protein